MIWSPFAFFSEIYGAASARWGNAISDAGDWIALIPPARFAEIDRRLSGDFCTQLERFRQIMLGEALESYREELLTIDTIPDGGSLADYFIKEDYLREIGAYPEPISRLQAWGDFPAESWINFLNATRAIPVSVTGWGRDISSANLPFSEAKAAALAAFAAAEPEEIDSEEFKNCSIVYTYDYGDTWRYRLLHSAVRFTESNGGSGSLFVFAKFAYPAESADLDVPFLPGSDPEAMYRIAPPVTVAQGETVTIDPDPVQNVVQSQPEEGVSHYQIGYRMNPSGVFAFDKI